MKVSTQAFSLKRIFSVSQKGKRWIWVLVGVLVLSLTFLFWPGRVVEVATVQSQSVAPSSDIQTLTPEEVVKILIRRGIGPNDAELDILYAPTWYFEWNKRELPQTGAPVLAFFVMETTHIDDLTDELPFPLLWVGDQQIEPLSMKN